MKNKIIIYISAIIFSTFLFGCKSTQKTVDSTQYTPESQQFDNLVASYKSWDTFSSNGKITIDMGRNLSSSMQIKMIRAKSINISIRPVFGIEMVKIHITNDSIFMLDKMNKRYVAENISRFTQGIPFNIVTLQNLFLSRAFMINGGTLSKNDIKKVKIEDDTNGNWTITPKTTVEGLIYSFIITTSNELSKLNMIVAGNSAPFTAEYYNTKETEFGKIASKVKIDAKINNRNYSLTISFDPSNIKWNQIVDNSFSVGKEYKRSSISSYIYLY
ncbi:MAG: DUF4292 domain-containing protein [Muribaculaceae bacterium]|nr:DUF4292 domain-containing protein [Muribaculaceae bacterium]